MDSEKRPKKASSEVWFREISEKLDNITRILQGAGEKNHYRAMERLLRAYPKLKKMAEHPEDYGFFPVEKSKSVTVAPPPGTGITDKVVVNELFVESRKNSFKRTMESFSQLRAVIQSFEHRREYTIIRLLYMNEDIGGHDRGDDVRPYTWEEIAGEMDKLDVNCSLNTLRGWRSKLVQDMAVLMWPDAALTIDNSRKRNNVQGGVNTNGKAADSEP